MTGADPGNEALRVVEILKTSLASNRMRVKAGGKLRITKGIVLLHTHKGAAVLGHEWGTGLAFRVTGRNPDGSLQLSAPLVVKLSKWAVGLSLGWNSIYTVLLLHRDDQLDNIAIKSETLLGTDLSLRGEPTLESVTDQSLQKTELQVAQELDKPTLEQPEAITLSDSFMLCDLSLYGGHLSVDAAGMKSAYGRDVMPLEVLGGGIETPEALAKAAKTIAAELGALSQ